MGPADKAFSKPAKISGGKIFRRLLGPGNLTETCHHADNLGRKCTLLKKLWEKMIKL
jgi:hypothetical protein